MYSAKFTLASNDWNGRIVTPGIYSINNKKYMISLYSDDLCNKRSASICIEKIMYSSKYSGPKICLSIYEPIYIRRSRYDSYLLTKTDIDNLIYLFRSDYRSDNAIIQLGGGGTHVYDSDYEGNNTLWDYVIWTMYADYLTPRYLNMPDYTKLKIAENDVMNYDYIKYQNDIDIEINRKYFKRNDNYKSPQFLI